MALYTTTLGTILEAYAGYVEHASFPEEDTVITAAMDTLFNFPFPFYNDRPEDLENFKRYFCHYFYMREIGSETAGLFKHFLRVKLETIMPKYAELYKTTAIDFNPLFDYIERKTGKTNDTAQQINNTNRQSTGTNQSEDTTDTTATGKTLHNETPQGELSDIDSGKYLTNYTVSPNEGSEHAISSGSSSGSETTTGSNNIESEQTYTETIEGKHSTASYAAVLKEYRSIILNINESIVKDCECLFMGVW